MTIREALQSSGIDVLDAEVLLSSVLKKSRSWVVAHDNDALPTKESVAFKSAAERRKTGEPVAYITREKEFYGRSFRVTPAVLIPRPATEFLIEETLNFLKNPQKKIIEADTKISVVSFPLSDKQPRMIVDIGTGSGIIAVTLKKEGWEGKVLAVDVSRAALEIAKENAVRHAVREDVQCREGDGAGVIAMLREPFLVVSNPPYIPTGAVIEKNVKDFEPHAALFAGEKGLDVLTKIVQAAKNNPACTGIIVELQTDQVEAMEKLLC